MKLTEKIRNTPVNVTGGMKVSAMTLKHRAEQTMTECYTCGYNGLGCDCIRLANGDKITNPYFREVSEPNNITNDFVGPGYIPPFKPKNNGREINKKEKIMTEKSLSHRINNLACDIAEAICSGGVDTTNVATTMAYIERKLTSFLLSYQENLLRKNND